MFLPKIKIMKNLFFALIIASFFGCSPAQKESEKTETKEEKTPETVAQWSKNATIYEVNIRQHTLEGTFKAFEKDIPRIKEMGIEILWLMPISPIGKENRKGPMGSYYSITDYTAVNPEFGTLEDFKSLVKTAHENNMKVILDWVANHTAWDSPWMQNKDWYTLDSLGNPGPPEGTDWSDVVDLNYDNQEMKTAMKDAMKYWLTEADIDGFRCDVASWVPTEFWNDARAELDQVKPVFMLAEAEMPELHKKAFHMSYAWEFLHIMNSIAKGEMNLDAIDNYMAKEDTNHAPNDYRMYFVTNHDENSWNGTVYERFGEAYPAFATLAFTIDGMPLVYSGQEAGLNKALRFFDKDTINWEGYKLQDFYTKLLRLNQENPALFNGEAGGEFKRIKTSNDETVYAYTRTKGENQVVVVVNLTGDQPINITLEGEGFNGEFTDLFSNQKYNLKAGTSLALTPYDYKVFYK